MKAIFQNARTTAQPIRAQLKENRMALATAAKTGESDAQIQQLAAKEGKLLGQMVTIRTEAMSKAYALLTPDQRTKADQLMQQAKQNWQSRRAGRQHANG